MTILIATDLSEASRPALATAARLARRRDSALQILHCAEPPDGSTWDEILGTSSGDRDIVSSATARLDQFTRTSVAEGPTPEELDMRIEVAPPATGILEVADDLDAELTVVGATGRGSLTEYLFGSTADEIVRRSETPVLVVPEDDGADPYTEILAPVDFSDCSRLSLRRAADTARLDDARIHAMHAFYPPTQDPNAMTQTLRPERIQRLEAQRRERFEAFVDEIDWSGVDLERHLAVGDPSSAIVDYAGEIDADLVVMGTHGRRGLARFFIGSTTAQVLRSLPCSTLTLRSEE